MLKKDFKTNNFDLIRIVSAALVIINHSVAHLDLQTPFLFKMVQQFQRVPMFFVMSGYLLSASFERNNNLKNYFTNRLLRIYPALWACLIFTVVVFALIGRVNFFNSETLPWFFSQMLGIIYTPHFLLNFGFGSYNGSLWTILVELQFYIALPIIYFLSTLFSKKFLKEKTSDLYFYFLFALSVLLAICLKLYFPSDGLESKVEKVIRYTFLPHIYIFMSGILLQRLKIYKSDFVFGKGLYWAAAYLLFVYLVPDSAFKAVIAMMVLAVFTISIAYSKPGIATKFLNNRDISYGVYLYHGMLLTLLVQFNMKGSGYYLLLVAVVTFILACLSYKFVELPAMSLAKKKNKTRDSKDKPIFKKKFLPEVLSAGAFNASNGASAN